MNFSDLRMFISVTQHRSLQEAARQLNVTPSAISKSIRRLESDLGAPLFDRTGKSMLLNMGGQRLLERALSILHLTDQARAEFEGAEFRVRCRIAAPALLQWRFGAAIAEALTGRYDDSSLLLRPAYDDEAIDALMRGEVDFALITDASLRAAIEQSCESMPLGQLVMQLAAGRTHPLSAKARADTVRVTTKKVLQYDFACPTRSMFRGLQRGRHADGWHDEELPRRIRYWIDDLQVLLGLVKSGKALAYLPEFALQEYGLIKVQVSDCPFQCIESAHLVWRPVSAVGWQSVVVDSLRKIINRK